MISHPDVLTRAQQEIDRVVGKDRLPTFEDKDSLPYINALVHEAMRYETFDMQPPGYWWTSPFSDGTPPHR